MLSGAGVSPSSCPVVSFNAAEPSIAFLVILLRSSQGYVALHLIQNPRSILHFLGHAVRLEEFLE